MAGSTTRLGLRKPDDAPSLGDDIDVTTDISENMDKLDAAVGFFICTSGTRPTTTAWAGMMIYETDTGRAYMTATAGPTPTWIQLAISDSTSTHLGNLKFRAGGDSEDRFRIDAATGNLNWGSGSAASDISLLRTAANELALASGDIFKVGNGSTGDIVAGSCNGINGAAMASGTDTTTSASYVDWAGTTPLKSFSFVKRYAATRVRIDLAFTFYSTNNDTGPMVGVNLNSADHDIFRLDGANGSNGQRQNVVGTRFLSSIPAGTYTITGRWKRSTGTGTLTRSSGDWVSLAATEVPA